MGYGIRSGGIRTYWPDDTDTTMYIQTSDSASPTLAELLDKIQTKWPECSFENLIETITITSEKIHTDCLGYDLYDPMDYTDFIVITKTGGA